jgi:hypothetical protein
VSMHVDGPHAAAGNIDLAAGRYLRRGMAQSAADADAAGRHGRGVAKKTSPIEHVSLPFDASSGHWSRPSLRAVRGHSASKTRVNALVTRTSIYFISLS